MLLFAQDEDNDLDQQHDIILPRKRKHDEPVENTNLAGKKKHKNNKDVINELIQDEDIENQQMSDYEKVVAEYVCINKLLNFYVC